MQLRNPRHIFLSAGPICSLWGLQYILLGAWGGVMANMVNVIRAGSLLAPYRFHLVIYWLLNLAVIGFVAMVWSGWVDLLVMTAGLLANLSLLKADNRLYLGCYILAIQSCWLLYNFAVESWVGLATSALVILSNLIGMARYEGWLKPKAAALQAAE